MVSESMPNLWRGSVTLLAEAGAVVKGEVESFSIGLPRAMTESGDGAVVI